LKLLHVTTDESLQTILNDGLIPQIGERSQYYGEEQRAIYFFSNEDDMDNALCCWLGEWFDDYEGELHALMVEVSPERVAQTCDWEYICFDTIHPSKITYFKNLG